MSSFFAFVIIILIIILLVKILSLPIKFISKLILNSISGFALLFVFNLLGSIFGISLQINLLRCLICGFLGIPGLIIVLLFEIL